jgi:molybdopterin molybdotransferase
MISVEEARRLVAAHRPVWPVEEVPVETAVGRILAEAIHADRDFPPFDRVTMDGIAISGHHPGEVYEIESTQYAGEPPHTLSHSTHAIEVMTGAVLPVGTDTVVRYEDVSMVDGKAHLIGNPTPGQNVHRQGEDRRAGDLLVPSGTRLSAAEIAVAASVGKTQIHVERQPRIAVVSTGDELVPLDAAPLPHQIRRSNGAMLAADLHARGYPAETFHLPDDPGTLRQDLHNLLAAFDVLLLSGGVSAGKKDFLPQILAELGVERRFHQVAQRPGKPLWFGTQTAGPVVFALPGNPVSTFLCYLTYVVPFLQRAGGKGQGASRAVLAEPVMFKPPLTYFVPVATEFSEDGRQLAYPLKGSGSGDFANLLDCTGFLELPAERSEFAAGEAFAYWNFRG